MTAQQQATDKSSKDEHTKVIYNRAKNKFCYLAVASDEDSTTTYYADWSDADNYGTASKDGRTLQVVRYILILLTILPIGGAERN